jgi:hypothetical protein
MLVPTLPCCLWQRQRFETVAPATCRCADHTKARGRAGHYLRNYQKIPDFLWKSRWSGAHADRPAVTRKKKRLQVVARIRMTCASGSRLISPRAGAHIWGKGARILTEINRLPQFSAKIPPNFASLAAITEYLTRKGGNSMQRGMRRGLSVLIDLLLDVEIKWIRW